MSDQEHIEEEREDLFSFLRMYENMQPAFQTNTRQSGLSENLLYNHYLMPRNLLVNRPINQAIMNHFINPHTQLICVRRAFIGINCVTGLGVRVNNHNQRRITLLNGVEYPTNVDVYLIIPQIQGVTIRGPSRILHNASEFTHFALSYVKEWKIVHDSTRQIVSEQQNECSICIESNPTTRFVKTNCQHEYCVDCMKLHIQSYRNKTTKIVCPMCRSELNKIFVTEIDMQILLQDFINAL